MVLLDTNAWAWTLLQSSRLSKAARKANDGAKTRLLSPASVYEISLKVRLGKWPEIAGFAPNLVSIANTQGVEFTRLSPDICNKAGSLSWTHRDPFDRMIAATALAYDVPIISSDRVFDGLIDRIW